MSFIITGLDLETTGLDQAKGHRIIEIGMNCFETHDGVSFKKIAKTWLQRINPMREIDVNAYNVHGISTADLKGAPEWEEVAPKVQKILEKTNLLVCHNANFDVPFIVGELIRLELEVPDFDVFCTMEETREATPFGEVPNLGVLCRAYGVDYDEDEAHAADYDIDVTMECFFKGLNRQKYDIVGLNDFRNRKAAA